MKSTILFLKAIGVAIPTFISCLSFRSNHIYVFGAWFGKKFSDNSKALFLSDALKKSNVRAFWITKDDDVYSLMKQEGLNVLRATSVKGLYYQLRAGVAFYCTSSGDLFSRALGGAVHINLWHGIGGGKKIGFDSEQYYNTYEIINQKVEKIAFKNKFYVATSEIVRNEYISAFQVNMDSIIMSGQPRNDMFFDPDYKISTINTNQLKDKKIITYLPTHRRESGQKIDCEKLFDLEDLNSFCKKNNCVFIIKKHFYHSGEKEKLESYPYILDWTQEVAIDTNELLMITDYLISDYSSVATDYLLLNKPIFYYCYDLEKYLINDREMYWPYELITPGPKCKSYHDLISSLRFSIEDGKDEYQDERDRVLNMFYGPQARKMVSQDILNATSNILNKIRGQKR